MKDDGGTGTPRTYRFRFAPSYRLPAAAFGVTPTRAFVQLVDDRLRARFGLWRVETPVANVAGCEVSGPYQFLKTAGPAHLSLADRGLTFATNGDRGLCIRFHEPVRGIDPTGVLKHPALTVTVADVDGLQRDLSRS